MESTLIIRTSRPCNMHAWLFSNCHLDRKFSQSLTKTFWSFCLRLRLKERTLADSNSREVRATSLSAHLKCKAHSEAFTYLCTLTNGCVTARSRESSTHLTRTKLTKRSCQPSSQRSLRRHLLVFQPGSFCSARSPCHT